jgi:hypothetical protein
LIPKTKSDHELDSLATFLSSVAVILIWVVIFRVYPRGVPAITSALGQLIGGILGTFFSLVLVPGLAIYWRHRLTDPGHVSGNSRNAEWTVDASGPPKLAKFLLLLTPEKYHEPLLGDLEEKFCKVVLPEYGPRLARFWYWWQILISLSPLLWDQCKRILSVVLLKRLLG